MERYQYHDLDFRGTVSRVAYKTTNKEGQIRDKYANVYLPYGYDANNKQKRYNVLYLMHGGGGNPDAWLDCSKIKNMLDYLFYAKKAEPCIVVFPSYYKEVVNRVGGHVDRDFENFNVNFFQTELSHELLPVIEGHFNTYSENVTAEGLKASRDHRAFGGFSMGSCTTWYAFLENLEYFRYFLPLSGDCWKIEPLGGAKYPEQTAEVLKEAVVSSGFSAKDFNIFAATGTKDPAFQNLTPQIEAMKKLTDVFSFSEDRDAGNLHYEVLEDGVHAYEIVYDYVYNYLPHLFQ